MENPQFRTVKGLVNERSEKERGRGGGGGTGVAVIGATLIRGGPKIFYRSEGS